MIVSCEQNIVVHVLIGDFSVVRFICMPLQGRRYESVPRMKLSSTQNRDRRNVNLNFVVSSTCKEWQRLFDVRVLSVLKR